MMKKDGMKRQRKVEMKKRAGEKGGRENRGTKGEDRK